MEHLADKTGPAVSVKTFVLFDTETTGLQSHGHKPNITELCFIAVTKEELLRKQKPPRVLNKLVICFNPCNEIGPKASVKTGLCNDALEDMADFSKQAPLITMFLRNLPQPVCLIAHNGNGFDFPLLVSHLRCGGGEIPEDVLCTDSLEALRTFDGLPAVPKFLFKKRPANSSSTVIKTHQSCNDSSDNLKRTAKTLETSSKKNSKHAKVSPSHVVVRDKSYKLRDVYARMFGQPPSSSHTAEGDCLALLEILHSKQAEFVSWCDSFAVPLMNVSPMY